MEQSINRYYETNNSKVLDLLRKVNEQKDVFSSRIIDRSNEWLSKIGNIIKKDKTYLRYLSYQEIEILSYVLKTILDTSSNSKPVFWSKEFIIFLYDKMKNIQHLKDELESRIFTKYTIDNPDLLKKIILLYFSSIYGVFILKDNKLVIATDATNMSAKMDYKYFKLIENYISHCRVAINKSYRLITDTLKGLYTSKRTLEFSFVFEQFEIKNMIKNMQNKNISIDDELKLNASVFTKIAHSVRGLNKQRKTQRLSEYARNTYKGITRMFGGKTQKRKNRKTRKQKNY
jgi:hypothetical protein